MTAYNYIGNELDLFDKADTWKAYIRSMVSGHISGRVLEVGAGIGGTTRSLFNERVSQWTCLEPDRGHCDTIAARIADGTLPAACRVVHGIIDDLPDGSAFDTILYIDVLEHLEQDDAELKRACGRLAAGGRLIILSPAHQWLFSEFDRAIGHHRRYNKRSLAAVVPAELRRVMLRYLDSVGICLSFANKLLLRQQEITRAQIHFWDRTVIPLSRVTDRLSRYGLGKSVVGIWQKN